MKNKVWIELLRIDAQLNLCFKEWQKTGKKLLETCEKVDKIVRRYRNEHKTKSA